ncbi:hypothetical protein V6N13_042925 [Hibiscus sabdariffa]
MSHASILQVMIARRWMAVIVGEEAAWTVAVRNLITLSAMQREPLDEPCGCDQRQKDEMSPFIRSNLNPWIAYDPSTRVKPRGVWKPKVIEHG